MRAKNFIKFAVIAVVIAMIFAILGGNVKEVFRNIWKFAIETDKGYMWIVNIAIGAVVALAISQLKSKVATVVAIITFVLVVILSECLIWHRAEIGAILLNGISNKDAWIYIGLGVLASMMAYVIVGRNDGGDDNK